MHKKSLYLNKNSIASFLIIIVLLSGLLPELNIPFLGIDFFNFICPFAGCLILSLHLKKIKSIIPIYQNEIFLFIIFLLLLLVSSLLSYDKNLALKHYVKYLEIVIFFIGILFYITIKEYKFKLLRIYIYLNIVFGIIAVLIYFYPHFFRILLYEHLRGLNYLPRNESLMSNPNLYGVYSAIIFIQTLILLQERFLNFKTAIISSLFSLFGIIASGSKNGLFTFIIASGLYLLTHNNRKVNDKNIVIFKNISIILISIIIIFFTISVFTVKDKGSRPLAYKYYTLVNKTIIDRIYLWNGAANSIIENPVLGTGPSVHTYHHYLYTWKAVKIGDHHTHNIFLQIIVESGILGFSIFSLIIPLIYRLFKKNKYYIAYLLLTFLLGQLFDCFLYDYFMNVFFVTLLAIGIYENRKSDYRLNSVDT